MNKQKHLHFNTHTCVDSKLNMILDEIQPDGILWEGIQEILGYMLFKLNGYLMLFASICIKELQT
jgi:hypothetical protein